MWCSYDCEVDDRRKQLSIWSAAFLVVFLVCCAVIFWFHEDVSRSPAATYALLGLAGVSAILGPVLGGRALFGAFVDAVGRLGSKR